MTVHVALLRAVNVAGHNIVAMPDLRDLVSGLGMQDVRSLLQSGNLVFRGGAAAPARLEARLERAAAAGLGLITDFLVRTRAEWEAIVADNPFPDEARRDPGHLLVMCLKTAPERAGVTALRKAISGREAVQVRGRHAYITYPDGIGRSRLTATVIEKTLGTRGTGRNWNTVLKIGAAAGALATG